MINFKFFVKYESFLSAETYKKLRHKRIAMKTVFERVAQIRKSLSLSQVDMAKRVGMSTRGWQAVENGPSLPSSQTLTKLAEIDFNPTWILTGRGDMYLSKQEDLEALEKYNSLSADVSKPLETSSNKDLEEKYDILYGRVLDALSKVYNETGMKISLLNLGKIAAAKTKEITAASDNPDEWPGIVTYMASQVRKEILSGHTPSGTEKATA